MFYQSPSMFYQSPSMSYQRRSIQKVKPYAQVRSDRHPTLYCNPQKATTKNRQSDAMKPPETYIILDVHKE
jgi:hypothetical protein